MARDETVRSAACDWRAMMMLDAFRPRPKLESSRRMLAMCFDYARGEELETPLELRSWMVNRGPEYP